MTSLQEGFQDLYVLNWPIDVPAEDASAGLCQVIMKRPGGLLLGVPPGLIPPEALQGAATQGEDALLGPHKVLAVPAVIVAEGGDVVPDEDMDVQVVDVSMEVVQSLRLFSPEADEEEPMITFGLDKSVLPNPASLLSFAKEWIQVTGQGKTVFYSAEEGLEGPEAPFPKVAKAKQKAKPGEKAKKPSPQQVAEQIQHIASVLPAITDTLASIQEEQRRIKYVVEGQSLSPPPRPTQAPVSMSMQAFANLMQQPPKTRGVEHLPHPPPRPHRMQLDSPLDAQGQAEENPPVEESSSLALAVLEQSRALTSLVSQLSSGDPLLDVQSTGASTSSKGAQGRERLQRELADRKSEFCLTVMQNAYRRLKPASRAPSSLREIAASDFSMLTYLERFGGYGGAKDMGVMQYALSFILDCAIREDLVGVQEYAALLAVGLEQAAQDQGRWDLAFQLMLLEDPPSQMWSYRGGVSHRREGHGPLRPYARRDGLQWLWRIREKSILYKTSDWNLERGPRLRRRRAQQGPGPTRSQRGRSSRKQKEEETEEHSQQKMQPPKLRVPTSGSAGMSLTEFFYVRACHWRCLQREGTTSRPCWAGVWWECRCWECYL